MSDNVNHPAHYTKGGIETIDFIEAKELGLHEGSIIQYVTRWRHKNGIEDLKKARWYIDRLIQLEEKKQKDVSYWVRQSPGATGEATRNDEYHPIPRSVDWTRPPFVVKEEDMLSEPGLRQMSLKEEHEYIQSLKQIHLDADTPACPECLVPTFMCDHEEDDDWSPENCARPLDSDGNIFPGDGKVITNVHDLIDLIDEREQAREEVTWRYPAGHPYSPDRPTNPCGKGKCCHGG